MIPNPSVLLFGDRLVRGPKPFTLTLCVARPLEYAVAQALGAAMEVGA